MVLETEFLQRIVLVLAISLIIGLDRQRGSKKEMFSGVRTFILAGLFGLMSVYLGQLIGNYVIVLAAFGALSVLTIAGYFVEYKKNKNVGATTEIAFLMVFFIGVLSYFDKYPFFITIILGMITTMILVSKKELHSFSRNLTTKEIVSAVVFAILTFLILPALPDSTIDPLNAINPYKTWLSLVMVVSVGFFSYMLMKIFGANKGLLITGILGGFASSVAVAVSMATRVKENIKLLNPASFAVMISSSIVFVRVLLWTSILNMKLAQALALKVIILAVVGCLISYAFLKKSGSVRKIDLKIGSPLTLKPAIRFVFVYIAISVIIALVDKLGFTPVYMIAFVSGLVDVDAITISLAQFALTGHISYAAATNGIILATIANTITKWFLIHWIGNKRMMFQVGRVYITLIALSALLMSL
ncbi:MAG TPA: MgtC/SapB family protein [archaeon]|nr:MgtC/SapB family protein [archaeon]